MYSNGSNISIDLLCHQVEFTLSQLFSFCLVLKYLVFPLSCLFWNIYFSFSLYLSLIFRWIWIHCFLDLDCEMCFTEIATLRLVFFGSNFDFNCFQTWSQVQYVRGHSSWSSSIWHLCCKPPSSSLRIDELFVQLSVFSSRFLILFLLSSQYRKNSQYFLFYLP